MAYVSQIIMLCPETHTVLDVSYISVNLDEKIIIKKEKPKEPLTKNNTATWQGWRELL